jgi:methionyl-tRNA formyltransferase
MNIFYIGSAGALSLIPFRQLLSCGHNITAVGIYKPIVYKPIVYNTKIIALENESLALAASERNIPVIDLSAAVDDVLRQCTKYAVDLTLMSCYSKRLPDAIIAFSPLGCYNMHPSLLPAYRGPEPIFWQMRRAADMGVSWHEVIGDLDAGDIVASKKVFLDDGESYGEISLSLATAAASLLSTLLAEVKAGSVISAVQDPALASYFSYPQQADFIVDTRYSAQQLYNFMCATQAFSQLYRCETGAYRYNLIRALDYDNNASLDIVEVQGDRLFIPCSEGVLIASYTDKIPRSP